MQRNPFAETLQRLSVLDEAVRRFAPIFQLFEN
jgi:hypothetical protein